MTNSLHVLPSAVMAEPRDSESLYEFVNGLEIAMPPMSVESLMLANELTHRLANFAIDKGLGKAYTLMPVWMKVPDRMKYRRPDAIYVSYRRWPKGTPRVDDDAWEIVPEICVEVISPSDNMNEVEDKIDEYFEAGVSQVWVVLPKSRRIKVYRSPTDDDILTEADTLTGGDALPGFELKLAEFFAE